MKVAGGGPSVHACAVFFGAESRDGDKFNQTPYRSFYGLTTYVQTHTRGSTARTGAALHITSELSGESWVLQDG